MNTNSINVLMIGIAISDLVYMGILVYQQVLVFELSSQPVQCIPPFSYTTQYFLYFLAAVKDVARRLSSWLSALMAFLRFLIIKNALKRKYDFLSKKSAGLRIILFELTLSTFMSLFYLTRVTLIESKSPWTPGDQCGFTGNFTVYEFTDRDVFYSGPMVFEVFVIFEGFMKINTAVFLPLCAVLLIRELRKAEESRRKVSVGRKNSESKTDNTTNLVIAMTITSIVAEGPFGIMVMVQGFANGMTGVFVVGSGRVTKGLPTTKQAPLPASLPATLPDPPSVAANAFGIYQMIINDVISILLVFVTLNATTHCFVCLGVSSQYRRTVKELWTPIQTVWPSKTTSMTSVSAVGRID
ncbi:unnamed protein product [Caenorhabditis brenneri]